MRSFHWPTYNVDGNQKSGRTENPPVWMVEKNPGKEWDELPFPQLVFSPDFWLPSTV